MKKYIWIFLLSVFLLGSCKHLDVVKLDNNTNTEASEYTYKYYSQLLSNEVFPEIERTIDNFKNDHDIINKGTYPLLTAMILELLAEYIESDKLVVMTSPTVSVMEGKSVWGEIAFVDLRLVLFDKDVSGENFRIGIILKKRFLLKQIISRMGI